MGFAQSGPKGNFPLRNYIGLLGLLWQKATGWVA